MRVNEIPTAIARIAWRGPGGSALAADASAPMCSAWPEEKASSRRVACQRDDAQVPDDGSDGPAASDRIPFSKHEVG